MNLSEAIQIVNKFVYAKKGNPLSELQIAILEAAWDGEQYETIVKKKDLHFAKSHIKGTASELWILVSERFKGPTTIRKKNFRSTIGKLHRPEKTSIDGLIEIAQQLRSLLQGLEYKSRSDIIWKNNYFEWYIASPEKSEPILLKAVEGEASFTDVVDLQQSIADEKYAYGWLISLFRISPSARSFCDENPEICCYTLDELIEKYVALDHYFNWLESESGKKGISKKYIPLACVKDEIEQSTGKIVAKSRYEDRDGWLDGCVEQWLVDPSKGHIAILGEFGTGKTWFSMNFSMLKAKKYKEARRTNVSCPRLPILINLGEYAGIDSIDSIISHFLLRHRINTSRNGVSLFKALNKIGRLLIVLDGFDEMSIDLDKRQIIRNFELLSEIVVPSTKIIFTSRTEHFPEIGLAQNIINSQWQKADEYQPVKMHQFEVLELEKLNEQQIRKLLQHRASPPTISQIVSSHKLLDLAKRPVMIDLILDAFPEIQEEKEIDVSRIYLYAISRKMNIDIGGSDSSISLANKFYFLSEFSFYALDKGQASFSYAQITQQIDCFFNLILEKRDFSYWNHELASKTVLTRDSQGNYKAGHRSFLEFFVAYKFAAELGVLTPEFLEPLRNDLGLEANEEMDHTWSGYFQEEVSKSVSNNPEKYLTEFIPESFHRISETFGKYKLTKTIIMLLLPMMNLDDSHTQRLQEIICATRHVSVSQSSYVGGNIATLLVKSNRYALEGLDLSQTNLKGADLSTASLRKTVLHDAELADVDFTKVMNSLLSVAWSLDGRKVATGEFSGNVRIYDVLVESNQEDKTQVVGGRESFILNDHEHWVWSVAFSPDSQILASGSRDKTVKFWDVRSGKCLHTLNGHTEQVRAVAFSPDGKTLASASADGTVKIWNVHTHESICTLKSRNQFPMRAVAFSPDSKVLVSGGEDLDINLWDISSGQCLKRLQGHEGRIQSVSVSPDGQLIASGSVKNEIKVWDVASGKCLKDLVGHEDKIRQVKFISDSMISSCSEDKTIRLWNVYSGQCLKILEGHKDKVQSVDFHLNGRTLVSCSEDRTVKFWDVQSGENISTWKGHTNWIQAVAIDKKGNRLAFNGEEHTIKLWDIEQKKPRQVLRGHTGWIREICFSPNGKTIASCGEDRSIRIWDIRSEQCIHTFDCHSDKVLTLTFDGDGQLLLSGSADSTIKVWDLNEGICINTLEAQVEGRNNWIKSVAFSRDNKLIASGSTDGTIRLWDTCTGNISAYLQGHQNWVETVAFSLDGKLLASGSEDNTIKIWDVETNGCVTTLHGHKNSVHSVIFSGQDNILISGSADRDIKIWDIRSTQCIKTLSGHGNRIKTMSLCQDAQLLASGSTDETVRLWNIETGQHLQTFQDSPYEGLDFTGAKGLTDTQKNTLRFLGGLEVE